MEIMKGEKSPEIFLDDLKQKQNTFFAGYINNNQRLPGMLNWCFLFETLAGTLVAFYSEGMDVCLVRLRLCLRVRAALESASEPHCDALRGAGPGGC